MQTVTGMLTFADGRAELEDTAKFHDPRFDWCSLLRTIYYRTAEVVRALLADIFREFSANTTPIKSAFSIKLCQSVTSSQRCQPIRISPVPQAHASIPSSPRSVLLHALIFSRLQCRVSGADRWANTSGVLACGLR